MASVLILGVWFAALRDGSDLAFRGTYTLTFVGLLFAALAAKYFGPFWFGFALFGWGFFLLGYGPWMTPAVVANYGTSMEEVPLNPYLLSFEYIIDFIGFFYRAENGIDRTWANRVGICQSMLTLVFALIGGVTARIFASKARKAKRPEPTEPGHATCAPRGADGLPSSSS